MHGQERQKMPLAVLLRAIDNCQSINELFALVHREGIVIQMKSQNSASNIPYLPLEKNPQIMPLEKLKQQVRDAALASSRRHSKEELIRAVETCPTIEKLFELVKNEHIVIQMKSFHSASCLPRMNPEDMIPDTNTTPLDRLKEQVKEAVMYAN